MEEQKKREQIDRIIAKLRLLGLVSDAPTEKAAQADQGEQDGKQQKVSLLLAITKQLPPESRAALLEEAENRLRAAKAGA